jgi:CheY-like chemotaxis protein
MILKTLKKYGYNVIESHDGAQALALWQELNQPVDLLVTDMVMPGNVSGQQLAAQLLAKKPNLKVIYISGYSIDLIQSSYKLHEGLNYLPKPFLPTHLALAVRKCLDQQ